MLLGQEYNLYFHFFLVLTVFLGLVNTNFFSTGLALALLFDVIGFDYYGLVISPIEVFIATVLFILIFKMRKIKIKFFKADFIKFYFFVIFIIFTTLLCDLVLFNKSDYFRYIFRPIFWIFSTFLIVQFYENEEKLFNVIKLLPANLLLLTLLTTIFQLTLPVFSYYTLSSTYELDGFRTAGFAYGRALGPSREPAHLLPFALISVFYSRYFLSAMSQQLLIILGWILVGYLTDSRFIILAVPIFSMYIYYKSKKDLSKYLMLLFMPFFLIISYNFLPRLAGVFEIETDLSIAARLGSIIVMIYDYIKAPWQYFGLFEMSPNICSENVSSFIVQACDSYNPILNWTFSFALSLPFFITLFLMIFFTTYVNNKNRHLLISFYLSGIALYIQASPVIVIYILLSYLIYCLDKKNGL